MIDQSELLSKFLNSRNLLKNILHVYLEENFFKESIEKCFINNDIDFEEVNKLSKAIKINVYVKAYVYIIKVILGPKLRQNIHLESIYHKISVLKFDFENQDDLYDFAEMIKTDEENFFNIILTDILEKYDEMNGKVNKLAQENKNLKSINNNLENHFNNLEKEFQEEIKRSKDFLIKHNEIIEKLQINHEKNIEILTKNYNSIIDDNKKAKIILEGNIKKLEDHKIEIKKHCEETINSLKSQLLDNDYMIDRRLVGNCFIQYFDKKNKEKKIQQILLETLAGYLDYSNEERKILGLSPQSVNLSKSYANTTRDQINKATEDFTNYLSQV